MEGAVSESSVGEGGGGYKSGDGDVLGMSVTSGPPRLQ